MKNLAKFSVYVYRTEKPKNCQLNTNLNKSKINIYGRKKKHGFFPLLHYFSNSNALRLHRHYVRMQCLTLQWWKWPQSKFQTASAFVRDFLIGPKILRNYSFGTLNGRRRRTPRTALVFFKWPIFSVKIFHSRPDLFSWILVVLNWGVKED